MAARHARGARTQGDNDLHFALYRAQVPPEQWARDTLELARRVASPERLCEELELRHPQRWRADVGPHLHALAQLRGEHMLPYLEGHAIEVWSARRARGSREMIELARRRGWWELWARLTVLCTSAAEYDAEVRALVQDQASPEAQVRQQLLQLAGAPAAQGRDRAAAAGRSRTRRCWRSTSASHTTCAVRSAATSHPPSSSRARLCSSARSSSMTTSSSICSPAIWPHTSRARATRL